MTNNAMIKDSTFMLVFLGWGSTQDTEVFLYAMVDLWRVHEIVFQSIIAHFFAILFTLVSCFTKVTAGHPKYHVLKIDMGFGYLEEKFELKPHLDKNWFSIVNLS